ncbi:hypothetical protein DFH09DRAFT_1159319 [Mycena vulgaris]|nr:hypothetical protein DFH09DRAFT_1159319 [Mycena vulgaris]
MVEMNGGALSVFMSFLYARLYSFANSKPLELLVSSPVIRVLTPALHDHISPPLEIHIPDAPPFSPRSPRSPRELCAAEVKMRAGARASMNGK